MTKEIGIDQTAFEARFGKPLTNSQQAIIRSMIPQGCDGSSRNAEISIKEYEYQSFPRVRPDIPLVFTDTTEKDDGVFCGSPNQSNPACNMCTFYSFNQAGIVPVKYERFHGFIIEPRKL